MLCDPLGNITESEEYKLAVSSANMSTEERVRMEVDQQLEDYRKQVSRMPCGIILVNILTAGRFTKESGKV